MHRRRALVLSLAFIAIAAIAVYVGWAFYAGSKIDRGWTGLRPALPYLFAGAATVGLVLAGFVWLAIYSQRRGYDDRVGLDHLD